MCSAATWEILVVVAQYLDPKTLGIASCVCKSWYIAMSSNQIWKPICFAHYASLSTLHLLHPTISYQRLYSLAHISSIHRFPNPSKPRFSISQLIFTVDVFDGRDSHIFTLPKTGPGDGSVFRFDFDVCTEMEMEMSREVRVRWTAVLKGWRGVFLLMDCKGKGRFVCGGKERWFSEELPSPGCFWNGGTSGLVAEIGFGLCGNEKMRVKKVSIDILSVISWKYANIDDALRYLQHFLLPSAFV